MARLAWFCAVLLLTGQWCPAQQPAKNSEAALVGLHGPVHTVLTETLNYRDGSEGKALGSTLVEYDREGYTLEEYRYEPDGTVHSHTQYTRKGWQIFKAVTTSVVPGENRTMVQSFNRGGLVKREVYDGTGSVIEKTENEIPLQQGGTTVSRSIDSKQSESTLTETAETTDTASRVTRQMTTKDGKLYTDWLIQRDADGKPVSDALTFPDGSFNQRMERPDGTTLEHKYWAPTKTHTYQATDAHNRVLEVINESPTDYTKTTFRYDDAGRQTQIANYDRSGKLLRRTASKYQEDGNGNWTEQKEFHWEAASSLKRSQLTMLTRRTITYY